MCIKDRDMYPRILFPRPFDRVVSRQRLIDVQILLLDLSGQIVQLAELVQIYAGPHDRLDADKLFILSYLQIYE